MDTYPSYKDSGVEWIGDIPSGWDLVKVKNLFTFSKGSGISKKDIEKEGSSNCILYGELFTRFKNFNVIPDDFSKTNLKDKIVSNGNELLIPGSTTTTSVDLCNCKTLKHSGVQLGGDIIILKPRKSDIKNEFYSYYITTVTKPDFEMNGRGVTIHHIYPKQIREIYTPVPPLHEQQQISDYLDHKTLNIDTLIKKTEQKIELLKEQRISLISTTVTKGLNSNVEMKDSGVEWIGEIPSGWSLSKIKYLPNEEKNSFTDGDWIESKDLSDSGIRYITSGNIGSGNYKEQGSGYITEETFNKLKCTELFPGDLVMSRLFLPVGRSCILPNLNNRVITAVDNVILRPKECYSKFFLNFFFNSFYYSEHSKLISRGVTLTRISRGMLGNVHVVVPPLQEQQQIVDYLDKETSRIDKLVDIESKRIVLLKEYRQSLISEVVTGKVDVRDEVLV